MSPCRILFLCEGNAARSVLYEATLNHLGAGRFQAYSAGSRPLGQVRPEALAALVDLGIPVAGLRSKSWHEFAGKDAPPLDAVIRVCDLPEAGSPACPTFRGEVALSRWNMVDPALTTGSVVRIHRAYRQAQLRVLYRTLALTKVPVETLTRAALEDELDRIARLVEDR